MCVIDFGGFGRSCEVWGWPLHVDFPGPGDPAELEREFGGVDRDVLDEAAEGVPVGGGIGGV